MKKIFFKKYKSGDTVYVVSNVYPYGGFDIATMNYLKLVYAQENKRANGIPPRNPDDAARVFGIMIMDKHRAGACHYLSNLKSREDMDLSTPPTVAWWENIALDFRDRDVIVPYPPEYEALEERNTPNPNNQSCMDIPRSVEFIAGTWEGYIRPKYKQALSQWMRETGNGNGHPSSFADYTGLGEANRWVAFIFSQDLTIDGLFADSTNGRVPMGSQYESGFDTMSQSSNTSSVTPRKRPHRSTTANMSDLFDKCGATMKKLMKESMTMFIDSQK